MMKEAQVPNCQKKFILQCITNERDLRLDGRKSHEYRRISINFGCDLGSSHVTIGGTRVIAHVTCELGQPNQMRPNEGMMYVNVDLSSMAALHFESGRNSNLTVRINRTLERLLKDSRCVDMESLCVKTASSSTEIDKVWILRIDIIVLNHDGNLIDCCSIAALSALAHFKRPDITIDGDNVTVHKASEKDLLPLVLHHFPVTVTYITVHNGSVAVVDPSLAEERIADSIITFGLNSYRELCCINMDGIALASTELLMTCANWAAKKAEYLVKHIKAKLAEDTEQRKKGKLVGFSECLRLNKMSSLAEDKLELRLRHFHYDNTTIKSENTEMEIMESDSEETIEMKVEKLSEDFVTLSSNQKDCKWLPGTDDETEDSTQDTDESMSEMENRASYQANAFINSKISTTAQKDDKMTLLRTE